MIYLVEDDDSIRELVLYTLHTTGFEAEGFRNAADFWQALEKELPQLDLPVMMLTAKSSEYDRVVGLDSGADDYLPKPFGMMELVSRVRALLRRAAKPAAEDKLFTAGSLAVDVKRRAVTVDGEPVILTYKEFELLCYLLENRGVVLSRDQILTKIWDYNYSGETRTVDVHIRTLRQKLGDAGALIETVRGVGYRLAQD